MTKIEAIEIIAFKVLYVTIIRPYMYAAAFFRGTRLRMACAEADRQAVASRTNRYVVMYKNSFYVYNKGSMMALAKKLHKATKLHVEWPTLYIYKAEWKKLQNK